MFNSNTSRNPWILLGIASILIFGVQLGNPLGGGHSDEPLYIGIALDMAHSHHWFFPFYHGAPAFYKPPLLYWLIILALKLFPHHLIFAARLPAALCGVGLVLMTAKLGKMLFDEKKGLLAGWLALTAIPGTYAYSRATLMDIPMALCITTSLFLAVSAVKQNRAGFLGLSFVVAGLASLLKGPVGLALAIVPTMTLLTLERRWEILRRPASILGIFGGLALLALWPAILALQGYGKLWIQFFVLQENLGKFTAHLDPTTHATPVSVIWIHLFSQFAPWSLFLLAALMFFIFSRNEKNNATWFLISWILTVIFIFSLPEKKLSHYTLPALPAAALLAAALITNFSQTLIARVAFWTTGLIFAAVGVLLLFLTRIMGGAGNTLTIPAAALCFLSGALFLFQKRLDKAAYVTAGFLFLYALGLPGLMSTLNLSNLQQNIHHRQVYVYHRDLSMISAAFQQDIQSIGNPDELKNHNGLLIISQADQNDFIKTGMHFGPPLLAWTAWKDHIRILEILHAILVGDQNLLHEKILLTKPGTHPITRT